MAEKTQESESHIEKILREKQTELGSSEKGRKLAEDRLGNTVEENEALLIPFLLEDVAGNPELNQQDGIHPTAEGYKIVAENVVNTVSLTADSIIVLNVEEDAVISAREILFYGSKLTYDCIIKLVIYFAD